MSIFPYNIFAIMFIREKKKSKKNVSYVQYQLIRSVRTPAGPRQELVLNMGQQLDLPKEKWKILANAIEEKLLKKNSLFLYDSEIDTLAKYYAESKDDGSIDISKDNYKSQHIYLAPSLITDIIEIMN